MDRYILNDSDEPVRCDDLTEWREFFESSTRIIAKTDLSRAGCEVSTVFLGMDYGFAPGNPVLFETMIFGGENDQYQVRCRTMQQALQQHIDTVKVAMLEYET